MKITQIFKDFSDSEKFGGFVLLFCTMVSLLLANSNFGESYHHFWTTQFLGRSFEFWVNDGLMTIFFLLIGLELEREIYQGELSNLKEALLPIIAAFGGMIVPAGIFLIFNFGTETQSGAGIPMATDIAFALAVLSLLGKRVPVSLKIFLTALAVIDDLGAILVIAVFYTKSIVWSNLIIAVSIFLVLYLLGKYLKIRNLIPYILGGIAMWYFMLHSGIHASITGFLLAFAIPFGDGNIKSTSYILQQFLHKPVAFFVLPVFALANTAIFLSSNSFSLFNENYSLGILFGLIIGKPLGIFLFCYIGVKTKICKLSTDLNWKIISGVGFLGGIGFTMSIFITLLAFDNALIINNAKSIILISSFVSGCFGILFLNKSLPKNQNSDY